jgi:hypothetical protein
MNAVAYFAEILRGLVGFFFLFAAIGKFKSLADFTSNLHESFGLSLRTSDLVAPALVAIECVLAVLMLSNLEASYPAVAAALCLLLFFSGVLVFKTWKDGAVACGCFGEAERTVSSYDIARNVLVAGAALFYLVFAEPASAMGISAQLLAAALALMLAVLAVEFHEVCTMLGRSLKGIW